MPGNLAEKRQFEKRKSFCFYEYVSIGYQPIHFFPALTDILQRVFGSAKISSSLFMSGFRGFVPLWFSLLLAPYLKRWHIVEASLEFDNVIASVSRNPVHISTDGQNQQGITEIFKGERCHQRQLTHPLKIV